MSKKKHLDIVRALTISDIIANSDKDQVLYDAAALNDINAAVEKFVPVTNEDDDFLKKLIKTLIINKGINIKMFQHKLEHRYVLTNMRSALVKDTKMTVFNFMTWCELLMAKFSVSVLFAIGNDSVDLTYSSIDNSVISEYYRGEPPTQFSGFPMEISESDDFLKRLVKQIIISKKVQMKDLTHMMDKKYAVTNMKSALVNTTKMTVNNFMLWSELLDFRFIMDIDNISDDASFPLKSSIIYDSTINNIRNN